MEVPVEFTGGAIVLGMGVPPKPDFWLHQGTPQKPHIHIAFRADNRAAVDAFYQAAIAAGGKDNGPPGPAAALPPELLRRVRARPRRAQHRSRAATRRRSGLAGSVLAVGGLILEFRLQFRLVDLDHQIVEGAVRLLCRRRRR